MEPLTYIIIIILLIVVLSFWLYSKVRVEKEKEKDIKRIVKEKEVENIVEDSNSNENTLESVLYDIRENTQNMLFWVRFWSILSLIGIGIYFFIMIAFSR